MNIQILFLPFLPRWYNCSRPQWLPSKVHVSCDIHLNNIQELDNTSENAPLIPSQLLYPTQLPTPILLPVSFKFLHENASIQEPHPMLLSINSAERPAQASVPTHLLHVLVVGDSKIVLDSGRSTRARVVEDDWVQRPPLEDVVSGKHTDDMSHLRMPTSAEVDTS